MASIFDQYGVKEVVDGTFYALEDDSRLNVLKGQPVLFLDTLKVSTAEVTADQTEAKGGRGSATLIIWDFNKEITITLQDALISPLSLALITGGSVTESSNSVATKVQQHSSIKPSSNGNSITIGGNVTVDENSTHYAIYNGTRYSGNASSNVISFNGATFTTSNEVEVFYTVKIGGTAGYTGDATLITIDSANYPGTYKFVGDTVIRSFDTGADEPFQMVVEKCKMNSEFTITMEAEGEPSIFDMNLRVLRDKDGNMIKFIKYNLD